MGFRKFGVLLLLIAVQLHPLLALSRISASINPFISRDFNHEQNVATDRSVPKRLSTSVKLGVKQNMTVVNRRGGGGGGGGHGGGRVGGGGGGRVGGGDSLGGDRGSSGGKKSPNTQAGGVVIPVYAAGAAGAMHHRNSHGSNAGTLNYVSLDYLILTLFASFFLLNF